MLFFNLLETLTPDNMFCSPAFDLTKADTFTRVIPLQNRQNPAQQQPVNQQQAFTNQSERLSTQLDAVELAIINHVRLLTNWQ